MPRLCRPGAEKIPPDSANSIRNRYFFFLLPPPPSFGVNSDQFSSNLRVEQIALRGIRALLLEAAWQKKKEDGWRLYRDFFRFVKSRDFFFLPPSS